MRILNRAATSATTKRSVTTLVNRWFHKKVVAAHDPHLPLLPLTQRAEAVRMEVTIQVKTDLDLGREADPAMETALDLGRTGTPYWLISGITSVLAAPAAGRWNIPVRGPALSLAKGKTASTVSFCKSSSTTLLFWTLKSG
jgi:hypothetical protein